MDQYKLEHQKGSGTFSVVFTAHSLKMGGKVAIKCMKKKFDSLEKVKKLKEIQALNILSSHENIIKLLEALYDEPSGKLALVFQLMDMNLYQFMKTKKTAMSYSQIKHYMFQVLKAIQLMHRKGIFHRDIKPENILIKGQVAKLADLGSCKGIHSKHPYTDYISTRWYRAPECLLTDGYYNEKMDIWGFGCVLFQLITKKPLFPGKDELDQVNRIHNIIGTPKTQVLDYFRAHATHMQINFAKKVGMGIDALLPKDCPPDLKDILHLLLAYDKQQRITAQQAMKHEYFAKVQNFISQTNQSNNLGNLRSTFFTMKSSQVQMQQMRDRSEGSQIQSFKKKTLTKSKNKKTDSKSNLGKNQDERGLPKIGGMTNYGNFKQSLYNKKFSNQINFGVQGRKSP